MKLYQNNLLHRALALATVLTLAVAASLPAQTSDDEKAKLKQQIEQLKLENQQLRQALAVSSGATAPAAVTAQASPLTPPASQDQALTHWLTTSSNKRHNSSCRWYRNSKGRPCRADEGIPCKICGG